MDKKLILARVLKKLAMTKDETLEILSPYIDEVKQGFLKKTILPREFDALDEVYEKSKNIKKVYHEGEKFGFSFSNYRFDIVNNILTIHETKFSPKDFVPDVKMHGIKELTF